MLVVIVLYLFMTTSKTSMVFGSVASMFCIIVVKLFDVVIDCVLGMFIEEFKVVCMFVSVSWLKCCLIVMKGLIIVINVLSMAFLTASAFACVVVLLVSFVNVILMFLMYVWNEFWVEMSCLSVSELSFFVMDVLSVVWSEY